MQTNNLGFFDVRAPTNKPSGLDFLLAIGTVHAHRGSTAQRAFAFPVNRTVRDSNGPAWGADEKTPTRLHPAWIESDLIEVLAIARRTAVRQSAREVNQSVLRTGRGTDRCAALLKK